MAEDQSSRKEGTFLRSDPPTGLMVARAVIPRLNTWLNDLPDPRVRQMCRYAAAHIWWHIIATYLSRKGSRNGFDEQRQSGQAAWNMGLLCGQTAEDPRFEGQPTVTCSDNAAYHANRVDPEKVARIPVLMFHDLLDRRLFDSARLFGRWYSHRAGRQREGKVSRRFRGGRQVLHQRRPLPLCPPSIGYGTPGHALSPHARGNGRA